MLPILLASRSGRVRSHRLDHSTAHWSRSTCPGSRSASIS